MGTAIVVTSGKGGTGKTSITGGVAGSLARLGHSVLCIDMDIGLRNLDISLGLSDRALMDFSDVAEGRCPLVRAAVNHPDLPGLALLTAPMTLSSALTEEAVRRMLDTARSLHRLPDGLLRGRPGHRRLHQRRFFPSGRPAHRG